jgi:LacI family transcriptional regulator
MTIGFIAPDFTSAFFSKAFNAVENVAEQHGYGVMIGNSSGQLEKEKALLQHFVIRGVAGIIISATCYIKNYRQFFELDSLAVPVVFLNNIPDEGDISFVAPDFTLGLISGIKTLMNRGYQRFGLINGPTHLNASVQNLLAYQAALTSIKVPVDRMLIVTSNLSVNSNIKALNQLLCLKGPPDLIFVFDANVLEDCLSISEESGKLGREIKFICLSSLPESGNLRIAILGYIEQFSAVQGKLAADHLFQAIHFKTKNVFLKRIAALIETELDIRDY